MDETVIALLGTVLGFVLATGYESCERSVAARANHSIAGTR